MELQVKAFLASLESQAEYSNSTRQAYAGDLRRFVEYLTNSLGRSPEISDFNTKNISNYLKSERRAGRQSSTLYRRRATLRTFSRFLCQEGYLEKDPMLEDTFLKKEIKDGASPGKVNYLTSKEIERIKQVMEKAGHPRAYRDMAVFTLLLESGLSIGALVALDLSNLDLRAKHLNIPLDDKGSITLPLRGAVAALQHYLQEGRPELCQSSGEPALFVSQMGGRMSRQGVWQVLRNWGELAGLSKDLSPRLIRHTAAKRMIADGRSVKDIQRMLGHRNPLSTRALLRRFKSVSGNQNM